MSKRWKYPFYVIAILLLVMWLFGCSSAGRTSAPSGVQVEDASSQQGSGASEAVYVHVKGPNA